MYISSKRKKIISVSYVDCYGVTGGNNSLYPHNRHVLLPCWCSNTKDRATKFPLNVDRQRFCTSIPRLQFSQEADFYWTDSSQTHRIPVPTVTSDVEYWPSCSLCCLHLQIPSHEDPQSGLGHHHRNCTQGFPLALRVTDSNTKVGKWKYRQERCKCVKSIKLL